MCAYSEPRICAPHNQLDHHSLQYEAHVKLTMPDKSRCSSRQSAIPQTSHPLLPDPLLDQPQARPTTLSLLSSLDGIDRGERHPETSRGDARSHSLDKYRPREGGKEGEDAGIGGGIAKSGKGTLESKS